MTIFLPLLLIAIFILLGCWHLYWAMGGAVMRTATIPTLNGKPTIDPPPWLVTLVGLLLLSMAGLVAATAGLVSVPISAGALAGLCYGLAMVFLIRAIGDFNLVGFFKRIRDSRFSRWDTFAYSPLCLALSVGLFLTPRVAAA
ncbi:MAG: DUF3995 domain-containing protein [Immundisolibacteraceae bacterium]|nr:DUF3995 domain-containing protein [Immundisolibacteraceae bacterium]